MWPPCVLNSPRYTLRCDRDVVTRGCDWPWSCRRADSFFAGEPLFDCSLSSGVALCGGGADRDVSRSDAHECASSFTANESSFAARETMHTKHQGGEHTLVRFVRVVHRCDSGQVDACGGVCRAISCCANHEWNTAKKVDETFLDVHKPHCCRSDSRNVIHMSAKIIHVMSNHGHTNPTSLLRASANNVEKNVACDQMSLWTSNCTSSFLFELQKYTLLTLTHKTQQRA